MAGPDASVIECIVNISEGRDAAVLDTLRSAAGAALLDLHCDEHHNRSVLTLVGVDAVREVAAVAVSQLDLAHHVGVHPRFGVVDVVPFVALGSSTPAQALSARNAYGEWSAARLAVPCFRYGPERSLPEVRRTAFITLRPDSGPEVAHPTAGATAVGQRGVLVAYNVWLHDTDLATARRIASSVRSPAVRTLGLAVGRHTQVSMNLIAPEQVGPEQVYDQVAALAPIERAELVGLVPSAVLRLVPSHRWRELDLAEDRTIEARLEERGVQPA